MAKIPIALQLWSVREDCDRDFIGTLEAVANMGYEGVEFVGYGDRNAGDLRDILDGLGLKVAGTHIDIEDMLDDNLEKTIRFNKALGNRFLIVPGLPDELANSKASWLEAARIMNSIAEKLKPEGMYVGYHNHVSELQPINGELGWDIFFSATHDVVMQLDTGHAIRAGADPLEILKRYPGRAVTVHLKEFSSKNEEALIGEGEMRWQDFFLLCETVGGTKWYIVEQETYPFSPLECVKYCLDNLRKMLG